MSNAHATLNCIKHKRRMDIELEIIQDIAKRRQLGVAKYGQTVADNPLPLRDWLQHAYEEILDQAVYVRRAIDEIDNPPEVPKPDTSWRYYKRHGDEIVFAWNGSCLWEWEGPEKWWMVIFVSRVKDTPSAFASQLERSGGVCRPEFDRLNEYSILKMKDLTQPQ